MIIATKTTREWFVFSISHSVLRKRRNEVPEKTERRLSLCPQSSPARRGNTENRGISVNTNGHEP
jgi:hypothetical protein